MDILSDAPATNLSAGVSPSDEDQLPPLVAGEECPKCDSQPFPIANIDEVNVARVIKEAQETSNKTRSTNPDALTWHDNADTLDENLRWTSENAYIDIANKIVGSATEQLKQQNKSKNELKKKFTNFFVAFISAEYAVLAVLMFFRTFQNSSFLSDGVIITYISSVFVETLGAIIIMIKYAFESKQEKEILEILNSIISRFKKFDTTSTSDSGLEKK